MTIELATAINILATTYKNIKLLSDKVNNLELKPIIVDMGGQILDLEMAAKEYQLKIFELESEIKRLTALSEKELTMKDGTLYDNKTGMGPYCPNCYENKKQLNLMAEIGSIYKYLCMECKYGIKK